MNFVFKWIDSPVGLLRLVASDAGLAAVLWENDDPRRVRLGDQVKDNGHATLEAERQLAEYFKRDRKAFKIPLSFAGTPFQKKVWQALLAIPDGETRSYSEIANEIGHPAAARAVGAANGRNPLSIIAPCHRVVGASGSLTGFAGGLEVKRYLLDLEGGSPLDVQRHLYLHPEPACRPILHVTDPVDAGGDRGRPGAKGVQT
jgi:methylated-DNA-[protein]-cysteine S-methyltransferase